MADRKLKEQVNPPWIKPSMTVEQAARQADVRGCILKSSWNGLTGVRIVAVPRDR